MRLLDVVIALQSSELMFTELSQGVQASRRLCRPWHDMLNFIAIMLCSYAESLM